MFNQNKQLKERIITFYGSARTKPDDPDYKTTYETAKLLSQNGYSILTGAGPGQMEAASIGGEKGKVYGLSIKLPFESRANQIIQNRPTHIACNRFLTRKEGLQNNSNAFVVTPGGIGTHDELHEIWTLMQCGKFPIKPIILLNSQDNQYWAQFLKWIKTGLVDTKYVNPEDLNFIYYAKTPEEVVNHIQHFYKNFREMLYNENTDTWTFFFNNEIPYHVLETAQKNFGHILVDNKKFEILPIPSDKGYFMSARIQASKMGIMRQFIDFINNAY